MIARLGIDPGKSGGFALITRDGVTLRPMPDTDTGIMDCLRELRDEAAGCELRAIIERVPTFAGRALPGHAMAVLHGNARFIEGLLCAWMIPVVRPTPQAWQKHYGLGTRADAGSPAKWKRRLLDEARRRWPLAEGLTLRTCDALLIAAAGAGG